MPGLPARVITLKEKFLAAFSKRDLFFWLFLSVFAFQLLLVILQCRDLVDDAYISARYGRNLTNGFGLVYNRSPADAGLERVEGYSNFLWVIILALGFKLGLTARFIAQFLGVTFSLASSALLFLWVRRETENKWLGLIAAAMLATNLYFAIWQVEGLETPLFSLVLIATVYALSLERNWTANILCLLFALTRPDGILLFAVIAAAQFFRLSKEPMSRRRTALGWLWFLIPYLAYFLWRSIYYRSLLPNTFYAKTGLGLAGLREGAIYLGNFFINNPASLVLILVIVAGAVWAKQLSFSIKVSLAFCAAYLLFLLAAGGDWMPGFRLAVPLLPLFAGVGMILFGSQWLSGKNEGKDRGLLYLVTGLALALNIFSVVRYRATKSHDQTWHRDQSKFYVPAADWLKKYVWQDQTIALGDIGYIGYFANHDRIIDTMGLVDRHLGRLPGISSLTTDLDYIFNQEPFCIVSLEHRYPDGTVIGHSEFDRAIAGDARLKMEYRKATEIFGWDSEELSRTDWKKRTSKVYFIIYLRNLP